MLQQRKTPELSGDEQFQISAFFSLQERRPRILKQDDAFAVLDPKGDFVSGFGSSDGLYFQDTRYLSGYELLIAGLRPILLSSSLTDDNRSPAFGPEQPAPDDADPYQRVAAFAGRSV